MAAHGNPFFVESAISEYFGRMRPEQVKYIQCIDSYFECPEEFKYSDLEIKFIRALLKANIPSVEIDTWEYSNEIPNGDPIKCSVEITLEQGYDLTKKGRFDAAAKYKKMIESVAQMCKTASECETACLSHFSHVRTVNPKTPFFYTDTYTYYKRISSDQD